MSLKCLSRAALNASTVTHLRLRTSGGRELNSLGPLWGSDANRMFLMRSGAVDRRGGCKHERPLRLLSSATMGVESKLGTRPSSIFQVYST